MPKINYSEGRKAIQSIARLLPSESKSLGSRFAESLAHEPKVVTPKVVTPKLIQKPKVPQKIVFTEEPEVVHAIQEPRMEYRVKRLQNPSGSDYYLVDRNGEIFDHNANKFAQSAEELSPASEDARINYEFGDPRNPWFGDYHAMRTRLLRRGPERAKQRYFINLGNGRGNAVENPQEFASIFGETPSLKAPRVQKEAEVLAVENPYAAPEISDPWYYQHTNEAQNLAAQQQQINEMNELAAQQQLMDSLPGNEQGFHWFDMI